MKKGINTLFLFLTLFSFLLAARGAEWQSFYPLNKPRAGAASLVFEGKIYVFGGKTLNNNILNTVECFDPSRQKWIENAIPPFKTERYNAAAIAFAGKIYLIGGRSSEEILEDVEVFDPVQNEWADVQDIHEGREGHLAFILENHIHILGGQENEYELQKEIEWYDETNDKWEKEKEKCPYPRVAPFGASVGDIFYLFGGYYYGMSEKSYRWNKNSMHKPWQSLPSLEQPRAYGTTVVKGDSIFLIGGETPSGMSASVEVFDIKTESISRGTPLPAPRSGLSGVCLNDTIFVMGGYDHNSGAPVADVQILLETATAIKIHPSRPLPQSQILIHGYPNPFNGQISLDITIPQLASYRIDIYNLRGQHIKSLFNGMLTGGTQHLKWYGKNDQGQAVSSGIYWLLVRSTIGQSRFKIIYAR